MIEGKHEFQVSAEELEYLKQLVSRHELLAGLLRPRRGSDGRRATIGLSRVEAEQLRDYLTMKLAAAGFDKNYSPNEQGQMLERLIDRFYLR